MGVRLEMKKESNASLSEGNLHFLSGVNAIVEFCDGPEAIIEAVELDKRHVLVGRLLFFIIFH